MKRFLLATVALAALSAPAAAADLATKYPVKAVVAAPVFSWTGFYIGANVGYGGNSFDFNSTYIDTDPVFGYSSVFNQNLNSSGFFAGGQIGYNYQFANNVVLGIETDLQWADISGQNNYSYSDSLGGVYGGTYGAKIEYFGTIRARLGYAIDRFLPYITGGVAYGKSNYTNNNYSNVFFGGGNYAFSDSSTNWDWTIGAGGEFAITNNWTFKAEYLYVDLGTTDVSSLYVGTTLPWAAYGESYDNKFHTFKAGVNYKF